MKKIFISFLSMLVVVAGDVYGDDTEVFMVNKQSAPNIMLVVDYSGSMSKGPDGGNAKRGDRKIDIARKAVNQIVNSDFDAPPNMGFLPFRNWIAGGPYFPVGGLDEDAAKIDADIPKGMKVKEVLSNLAERHEIGGETPTVDALYEAARYFRGDNLYFARGGNFGRWENRKRPPSYPVGGSNMRSANPAAYKGRVSISFVDKKTPYGNGVQNAWCRDYSARRPKPGRNNCKDVPKNSIVSCKTYGVKACKKKKVKTCVKWGSKVKSSCLRGPGSKLDVWLWGKAPNQSCCTKADATNGECLSSTSLKYCVKYEMKEQCVGGRKPSQVFTDCKYKRRVVDTRRYETPIAKECQSNAIVLISDGAPSRNNTDDGLGWRKNVRSMIAKGLGKRVGDVGCEDLSASVFGQGKGQYTYGNCGPELTKFMATHDQVKSVSGSAVKTYSVGFGLTGKGSTEAKRYLELLAKNGAGEFYEADDLDSLVGSIKSIIDSVSASSGNFSGTAISVDNAALSTDNKAIKPVFKPENKRSWTGNFKGYFVTKAGLVGVNGLSASDSGVQSLWSVTADGQSVVAGGLRSMLVAGERNVYTVLDERSMGKVVTKDNEISNGNKKVTAALLGYSDRKGRQDGIEWLNGDDIRDPLHTEPVVVDYGDRKVMFAGTNAGFLHAFDVTHPKDEADHASGGEELFAYIPFDLLKNVKDLVHNRVVGGHIYGIDGPITVRAKDVDGDGKITRSTDRVMLYFGLRRGGRSYYALDVTDPEDPVFKWKIGSDDAAYSGLGQSWSKIKVIKIKVGDEEKEVLLVGGGYDKAYDAAPNKNMKTKIGNVVYLIDPDTGERLISFGGADADIIVSGMDYSIPSDIRAIDLDGDGNTDRFYFGDLGGQVWSVSLIAPDASIGDASKYRVRKVASLADGKVRRFFYPPAVSYQRVKGGYVLTLSIGSGNRANPLGFGTDNAVFTLIDTSLDTDDEGVYPVITVAGLNDYSLIDTKVGDLKDGWLMKLRNGEKVLGEVVVIGRRLMFSSFKGVGSTCSVSGIENRFYMVGLIGARGKVNIAEISKKDIEIEYGNRSYIVSNKGILSSPAITMPGVDVNGGEMDVYAGGELVYTIPQHVYSVFWDEVK